MSKYVLNNIYYFQQTTIILTCHSTFLQVLRPLPKSNTDDQTNKRHTYKVDTTNHL